MSNWKFSEWYKTNGQKLNESRRDRYKTDPEYRKQVLDANRESRRRAREKQIQDKAEAYKNTTGLVKADATPKWKTVEQDGKTYVTIGALASVLGRSKLGVRLLEKKGHLPPTPYRNEAGERLYTPEMVLQAREALAAKNMLEPRKTARIPENVLCDVKLSDGSTVRTHVFRIGILAQAIGRSPITLEQMERRKAIPSTTLRLPPNRRVFTAEQIQAVKKAFDRRSNDLRVDTDKKLLREEILTEWKELKLVGAKVMDVVAGKSE